MLKAAVAAVTMLASTSAAAQIVPLSPTELSLDGRYAACGGVRIVLDPTLNDVGRAMPGYIILNPNVLAPMSTSMKLFWVGHECGHHFVGSNEAGADCWAIRLGRDQGWFPAYAFNEMIDQFRYNPGDFTHAPGPVRVQSMINCYNAL